MDFHTYKRLAVPGSPLAEVFSVIINLDDEEEEYELYGTIRVDDDEGTLYIYNVGREDSETICSNESLPLSNRDRAILAGSHFTVYFDLKDKNGDAEFIKDSFCWDVETDGRYNKCLVKDVKGRHGSATVYYTVHSVAVETYISAEFIKGGIGASGPYISGNLVACYKNWYDQRAYQDYLDDRYAYHDSKKHSQVTLFDGRMVELDDGDIFLLDRPVVTLPSYTSLVIKVYVHRYEDGQVLWNDEVEFSPSDINNWTVCKDIQGTFGVIRVSVHGFNYVERLFEWVQVLKDKMRQIGGLLSY